MGVGILQLSNNGISDKYLTGNPQITFFKTVYRRYSNFAKENIKLDFSTSVNLGHKATCKIPFNGDLIDKIYLEVNLPALKQNQSDSTYVGWINALGHHIIDFYELKIGGQTIDKHYSQWLDIWSEIYLDYSKQKSYNNMILKSTTNLYHTINGTESQTIFLPLNFWFSNPGLALPILCLKYHDVVIDIQFKNAINLLKSDKILINPLDLNNNPINIITSFIHVDYIYLDSDERNKFIKQEHEYLIEQVQFTGIKNIEPNILNYQTKFDHKHNVKEIYFCFQLQDKINLDTQYGNQHNNYNNEGNEIINEVEILINTLSVFGTKNSKWLSACNCFNYHSNSPNDFIYSYSFSLKPEDKQPAGSCNFTTLNDTRLNFRFKNIINKYVNLYVFSKNYNIFRVINGTGGLVF